jgi:hypothetical protein
MLSFRCQRTQKPKREKMKMWILVLLWAVELGKDDAVALSTRLLAAYSIPIASAPHRGPSGHPRFAIRP